MSLVEAFSVHWANTQLAASRPTKTPPQRHKIKVDIRDQQHKCSNARGFSIYEQFEEISNFGQTL
jgi:hypothetical protein